MSSRRERRPLARVTAAVAAAGLILVGFATTATAGGAPAETPPSEPPQVDAPIPELDWTACEGEGLEAFECTTAEVPTDYDRPNGATTTIALTRHPATDPEQRAGSLFLNFGGPGGPGVDTLHQFGPDFLDPEITARYDLIGFDPRGVGLSDPVTCFPDATSETEFFAEMQGFPTTTREEGRFIAQMGVLAAACATLSGDRISHSSTANVARDMDLLRQAVGDDRLTYIGYSYGTVLGATYGALFGERARALVLDGTLDPTAWSGGDGSVGYRIGQGVAAHEAFGAFHDACVEAGPEACSLAALGDPAEITESVLSSLKQEPVEVPLPEGGTQTLTYDAVVGTTFQALYSPSAFGLLADYYSQLAVLTAPGSEQPQARTLGGSSIGEILRELGLIEDYPSAGGALASMCVDGEHPLRPWDYPEQADAADAEAPHFGRARSWVGVTCDYVPFRDRDAYTGPWEQSIESPVLVIGTQWDPATAYSFTQPYADRFPDARVLTVEGYGHTTINVSACADAAIADYVIDLEATDGAVCQQDVLPFQDAPPELAEDRLRLAALQSF